MPPRKKIKPRARPHFKFKWVIDPRKALTFVSIWDALTASCLCFTATVTPFEVAFLPPQFGIAENPTLNPLNG